MSDKEYILNSHGFNIHLAPVPSQDDPEQVRIDVPSGELNKTLKEICYDRSLRLSVGIADTGNKDNKTLFDMNRALFKTNFSDRKCFARLTDRSSLGVPLGEVQCVFGNSVDNSKDKSGRWIEELKDSKGNVTGILFIEEETNNVIHDIWGEVWDITGDNLLQSFSIWNSDYGHRVIMSVNKYGDEILYLTDEIPDDSWKYRIWETDLEKRSMPRIIAVVPNEKRREQNFNLNTFMRSWEVNVRIRCKAKELREAGLPYDVKELFYDAL